MTITYLGMFSGDGMTFLPFNMHDNRSLVGSRSMEIVKLSKSLECSSDTVEHDDAGSMLTFEKNVRPELMMCKRKSEDLAKTYRAINDPQ